MINTPERQVFGKQNWEAVESAESLAMRDCVAYSWKS